jgi:glucose/arabinose dehydrogenase
VAIGGAADPPQEVLVQSWCQQFNSHSMSDIEFDAGGALLVGGGDGANFDASDFGQFGNPCGDPPDEGGSLRAQDVRTGGDPTDYSGAIVRVDRASGEALPDNPLFKDPTAPLLDNPDVRARRILAYGFRSPFRFELRPGTDELYVGDVGQDRWEELDRLASPPPPGAAAPNFGWPCFEGGDGANLSQPRWLVLEKPLCDSLYADPTAVTPPFWAYGHGDEGALFEGDRCNPYLGAAYAGLAFYEPVGVDPADAFPARYDGALFMSDASRGCVWAMLAGPGGEPDPARIEEFAISGEGGYVSVVDLVQGPDGALYGPDFYNSAIQEFRYGGYPEARIAASRVDGPIGAGFAVDFDATGSSDPHGTGLEYDWDLDGDGSYDDSPHGATAHAVYTEPENVRVRVRVRDGQGHRDSAALTVYPGDAGPPQPRILSPEQELGWSVGDIVEYAGTATDPGGDTLSGGGISLHWTFNVRHCPQLCHTHPFSQSESGSGTLVAPTHEYPSHLRLELTATDSRNRSTTVVRDVFPEVAVVGVGSMPPGLPLSIDGEPSTRGPFRYLAGTTATVTAVPAASRGGVEFEFVGWSDGGARTHQVEAGGPSRFLLARYRRIGAAGPQPTPRPLRSRIVLRSRPAGARLRLGSLRSLAPLAANLEVGSEATIAAPVAMQRAGRLLRFEEWRSGGRRASGSRRLRIVVGDAAAYVARYGRRPRASVSFVGGVRGWARLLGQRGDLEGPVGGRLQHFGCLLGGAGV